MEQKPETAKEIILSLPIRFRKEKCAEAGFSTVIHFNIDGTNGCKYTVTVNGGEINLEEGLVGTAKCEVTAKDKVYENVEWGRENGQMAFMMGKIKVTSIPEILQFSNMFRSLSRHYDEKQA